MPKDKNRPPPPPEVEAAAKAVAEQLAGDPEFAGFDGTMGSAVGFDWISILMPILSALFPKLAACLQNILGIFNPTPTPDLAPQNVSEFVTSHWNAGTGEYDDWIMARTVKRANKQAKKKGQSLTFDQAQRMAVRTLDYSRTNPTQTAACCAYYAGEEDDGE